jgi:hypothetical protein
MFGELGFQIRRLACRLIGHGGQGHRQLQAIGLDGQVVRLCGRCGDPLGRL